MIYRILFVFLCLLSHSQCYGNVYIVTGATGGIGSTIAESLANQGHELILLGRTPSKVQALNDKIRKLTSTSFATMAIDFNEPSSLTDLPKIYSKYKKIDGIVIITPRPSFDDNILPSSDSWKTTLQLCFLGPLDVLRAAMPYINHGGKIVIISGISSKEVLPGHSSSGVVRGMWLTLAKGLSHKLGQMKQIHVNTVSPGGVTTDAFMARLKQRASQHHQTIEQRVHTETENIPFRKYATPEEVTNLVIFLLSNQSNHVTGMNITIDGGFTRTY